MRKMTLAIQTLCLSAAALAVLSLSASAQEETFVDEFLYPEFNKTISMDFQDAKLGNVLKLLSQQSGMNFVASDSIKNKEINLYLDNVAVWEALERILEANTLTYELRPGSNIFMVKEREGKEVPFITRVYQLKHATVPSHLINTTLTFDDSLSGVGEGGGGAEGGGSGGASESDVGEGIVAAIQSVLSDDGEVVEDARTNSLIVTDHPGQFALIEQTIARLDVRIPQVLIEAEMLDISKSVADLLGARFSGDFVEITEGATKKSIFPFNTDEENVILDPQYTTSTLSFQKFNFIVQFLRTHTDTKNLARPRILTLNNQTATIAIKTNEAIGVTQETSSGGGGGIDTATEEAEREETGVFLKVTPQANVFSREITMALEPKVVQARSGTIEVNNQTVKDPEERGTKSILRVMDGDTIIIGGLLRTDVSDVRTSIPVISKVPIIGAAFRHKDKTETERELIVFITPHIVEEHLAANNQRDVRRFLREQDAPAGSQWASIEDDLSLMEGY